MKGSEKINIMKYVDDPGESLGGICSILNSLGASDGPPDESYEWWEVLMDGIDDYLLWDIEKNDPESRANMRGEDILDGAIDALSKAIRALELSSKGPLFPPGRARWEAKLWDRNLGVSYAFLKNKTSYLYPHLACVKRDMKLLSEVLTEARNRLPKSRPGRRWTAEQGLYVHLEHVWALAMHGVPKRPWGTIKTSSGGLTRWGQFVTAVFYAMDIEKDPDGVRRSVAKRRMDYSPKKKT